MQKTKEYLLKILIVIIVILVGGFNACCLLGILVGYPLVAGIIIAFQIGATVLLFTYNEVKETLYEIKERCRGRFRKL